MSPTVDARRFTSGHIRDQVMRRDFATIDKFHTDEWIGYFRPDGRLRFGNADPVTGAEQIRASLQPLFALLSGIHHEITGLWEDDNVSIVEADVSYTLRSGLVVTLLCGTGAVTAFALRAWPAPRVLTIAGVLLTVGTSVVLSSLGGYDLTYGGLAGVMIALIFFFVIGLGVVFGAELNAALAEVPEHLVKADAAAVIEQDGSHRGESI